MSKDNIKFIACGGGNDITKILNDLSIAYSFKNKKIAYAIIAAENDPPFLEIIHNGFSDLKKTFSALGAEEVFLIEQKNISYIYNAQIVIFSGGDTSLLIEVLKNKKFAKKIQNQRLGIEAVMGISAGSIALFEKGVGTKGKKEYLFDGLGLISGTIVVHSNEELQKKYPKAIHLKDYELYQDAN